MTFSARELAAKLGLAKIEGWRPALQASGASYLALRAGVS
jgi:hypothetical protein